MIVILLISAILSLALLTRGHLWGDDYASYIMQAQSVLNGTTHAFIQHNMFTIQESFFSPGPVAYPWGYPLLLAPVLAVFGLNLLALKAVSTLFFVLFLFVFYHLVRLRLPASWSLFLTAILAFNPALLQAHDLILSDVPFLFFSSLGIFLIEKYLRADKPESKPLIPVAIGFVIFAAFAIRTNGILLLGALAVAQLLRYRGMSEIRRNLTAFLMPYVVFGLLAALGLALLPNGQESYFAHYALLTTDLLLDNLYYYLKLPAALFADIPDYGVFGVLLIVNFLFSLFSNPRRNAAILMYILLTLVLFITWPERQGLRFIFPILPLILLIAAEEMYRRMEKRPSEKKPIDQWIGAGLAGILIILSLYVSAHVSWANLQNDRTINGPFDPVSAAMFEFVREQTPPDSVVIFFKPRAMRLLTDRDSFMTESCEDFSRVDYVVFHEKQGENGQVPDPEACTNAGLSVVFNNQRFTVYQVTR